LKPSKRQVPQAMIGRRLSQEEAKRCWRNSSEALGVSNKAGNVLYPTCRVSDFPETFLERSVRQRTYGDSIFSIQRLSALLRDLTRREVCPSTEALPFRKRAATTLFGPAMLLSGDAIQQVLRRALRLRRRMQRMHRQPESS